MPTKTQRLESFAENADERLVGRLELRVAGKARQAAAAAAAQKLLLWRRRHNMLLRRRSSYLVLLGRCGNLLPLRRHLREGRLYESQWISMATWCGPTLEAGGCYHIR